MSNTLQHICQQCNMKIFFHFTIDNNDIITYIY